LYADHEQTHVAYLAAYAVWWYRPANARHSDTTNTCSVGAAKVMPALLNSWNTNQGLEYRVRVVAFPAGYVYCRYSNQACVLDEPFILVNLPPMGDDTCAKREV
jgi:hypothetical protein